MVRYAYILTLQLLSVTGLQPLYASSISDPFVWTYHTVIHYHVHTGVYAYCMYIRYVFIIILYVGLDAYIIQHAADMMYVHTYCMHTILQYAYVFKQRL